MDVRYVKNWLKRELLDEAWPLPIKQHGLFLDAARGELGGVVVLWGRPVFGVSLGKLPSAPTLEKELPLLLLSDDGKEEEIAGWLAICSRFGLLNRDEPTNLLVPQ